MRKEFFKDEENTFGNKTSSDNNFDNLDLLNLPLSFSSDATSIKNRRHQLRQQTRLQQSQATGDDFYRHPRIVERHKIHHYNPSGDSSELGRYPTRGENKSLYCPECQAIGRGGDESVLCLYDNHRKFSRESLQRTVSATDAFLIPHYKKKRNAAAAAETCRIRANHNDCRNKVQVASSGGCNKDSRNNNQIHQVVSFSGFNKDIRTNETNKEPLIGDCNRDFSNSNNNREVNEPGIFPFKTTSSGNLKVNSHQVVFQSDKFSVLVADPEKTQVNISDQRACNNMQKESDYKSNAISAIMKQAGGLQGGLQSGLGTSLGSLLVGRFADAPVRKEKESSEYEGKATHEILDPELNLNRLGYTASDSIDWNEVVLPEKKNLYLELYARITNFTNADCKVYIDNEEFNCHLLVLQCYSEVFHTYVAVKKVELPSDKCSPSSFAFIYEWMITGDPSYRELNRENVLDIFNAAKYLKIKDLIEQCWAFIDNPEVFSEDTAFLLYVDAKDKNLPEVRELMLPRIEKFFLMLVSSQDWLELELDDVQNFLQSNYICVNWYVY